MPDVAISGKTRKLLWGRSYNACAICKKSLTRDADSPHLPGIVLGEEAHIVAKRPDGPRGDGDRSDVDGFNNLLLLCADDHKRVDEQPDVFTVDTLLQTKAAHLAWAAAKMAEDHASKPNDPVITMKAPGEDSIPLDPVLTGKQAWDLVANASAYYMRTVEGEVDDETAQSADDFLTTMRDWGDIAENVQERGFGAVREAQKSIQEMLLDLWAKDVIVYGRRVVRTLKGGTMAPSPWPTTHLIVMTGEELRERGGISEPPA